MGDKVIAILTEKDAFERLFRLKTKTPKAELSNRA